MSADVMTSGRVDSKRGGGSVTSWLFTYAEDGRSWSLLWDWRETQAFACALFEAWDVPEREPIDAAARERILEAVWPVLKEAHIEAIFDESRHLRCPVVARWTRGEGGFLIDVHDGGRIDYFELGRTLRFPYREPELNSALVDWPAAPRWTEPDAPIDEQATLRIQEGLQFHRESDVRIGGFRRWVIRFS